jgi:hypothetical protein
MRLVENAEVPNSGVVKQKVVGHRENNRHRSRQITSHYRRKRVCSRSWPSTAPILSQRRRKRPSMNDACPSGCGAPPQRQKVMVKIIEFWGFHYNEGNMPDLGHGNPPLMNWRDPIVLNGFRWQLPGTFVSESKIAVLAQRLSTIGVSCPFLSRQDLTLRGSMRSVLKTKRADLTFLGLSK